MKSGWKRQKYGKVPASSKVTSVGASAERVWFHIPSGLGGVPEVVVWLPPTRFQLTESPTLIVTVEGENEKSSANTSTDPPVLDPVVVVASSVVVTGASVVVGA